MVKIEWSKISNYDILQIYSYIYQDSVYYAVNTVTGIGKRTDNLEIFPYMGRKVPEYDIYNIRELIYKSHRIIYEVQSNKIIIHRIWHSARILPKQLIS